MRPFIVGTILIYCCLASGCGMRWAKVPTGAMQPTIKIGANVITDETAYASDQPINRFDIVIHKLPMKAELRKTGADENTKFIFRVIGLGGEKVELKNGRVIINDKILDEPFEKYPSK